MKVNEMYFESILRVVCRRFYIYIVNMTFFNPLSKIIISLPQMLILQIFIAI